MNYVDFTILLIAVIGFLYGLIKGVIRQVGSLGGFIAGMVVARFFGGSFSALLREMFDLPEGVSRVIAYSLLFLIVYIICVQLMRLIHHITHHVALGWLDRLAGALFGAVKYLVILSIVLNLVHIIDPKGKLISETKPTRGLFIPYSICNEPYLCCENCKAD